MPQRAIVIDQDRLAAITSLAEGMHTAPEHGMCAMEAAAYIVNEPFSDHPICVSPVIGAFMRAWNDDLPAEDRTRLLLPLIPKTIGTANGADLESRRAMMAMDWLIRIHTPAWLRLAGLTSQADLLANFPEINNMAKAPSLMPMLIAVRNDAAAAWEARRDAAGAAAWEARRDAAGTAGAAWAAWEAARDAAWAAGDAALAAVWTAKGGATGDAGLAAWDAARDAAGAALSKTKIEFQLSAAALVERMCMAE